MTAELDSATTPDGTDETPGAPPEQPTTPDADYVKKLRAEAAKYRNEAKVNADKIAAFEDAQKTEAERMNDRLRAAEAAAQQATADSLRWRIATRHGISDDLVDLYLTGTDEDTLTRQAEGLAAFKPAPPADGPAPFPRPDLSQGARSGTTAADPAQQFAHFLKQRMA